MQNVLAEFVNPLGSDHIQLFPLFGYDAVFLEFSFVKFQNSFFLFP